MLIAVHLELGYAVSVDPAFPLVGQGVAYSVFAAALWPSVPFAVPAGSEGLAYGFITAVQNGGLGAFPLLVSYVYDQAGEQYIPSAELLFIGFAAVRRTPAQRPHLLHPHGISQARPATSTAP